MTGRGAPPLLTGLSGLLAALVLPLAMFTANKSAALILCLVALTALGGVAQAKKLPQLVSPLSAPWPWPARLGALLALLAILSLGWTHAPPAAARSLAEAAIPLTAAVLTGLAWRIVPPQRLDMTLALGIGLAALAAIADLSTGMIYRVRMGIRTDTFVLNRSVVTDLLLLWPMLLLAGARGRLLALAVVAVVTVAIFRSDSETAKLALVASAVAFALALAAPRLAALAVFGTGALLLVLAPWIGQIAGRLLSARASAAIADAHAGDRIAIWQSFGAAVMERPMLGSGFGASTRMAADPLAGWVAEPLRLMLGAGHPHNSLLQIWVELGALGAVITLCLLAATLRAILAMERRVQPYAVALSASVLSISAVSHGAWQAWWIASVGAGVVLTLVAQRDRERT